MGSAIDAVDAFRRREQRSRQALDEAEARLTAEQHPAPAAGPPVPAAQPGAIDVVPPPTYPLHLSPERAPGSGMQAKTGTGDPAKVQAEPNVAGADDYGVGPKRPADPRPTPHIRFAFSDEFEDDEDDEENSANGIFSAAAGRGWS